MALTKIDDRGLTTPIDLLDDEKIRFGTTDNDLEIFHGSNISTIKDGKGDLRIMSDTIRIQRNAGGENYIYATEGGAVKLHYDGGNAKLETTSTGAKVTGALQTTGNVDVNGGSINLGVIDTSSGHINAAEVMTFNIDTDNDDTTRYFAFYNNGAGGSGTELFKIQEDGKVGIGVTPSYKLHVAEGTTDVVASFTSSDANAWIQLRDDDTNDTAVMIGANDDSMMLRAGSNTRMTIAHNGKVGIGEDDPDQKLHIYESATDSHCYLHVQNNRSRNAAIKFTTSQGSWYVGQGIGADVDRFMIYDSAEKFTIDANGHAKIHDGDLQIGTAGHGIDFSAQTASSTATTGNEILDHYEEGSFDVNYKTGAGGGNTLSAASYTTTGGLYTRIGDVVHFQIRLKCTSATTVGGQIVIEGLPFTQISSNITSGAYVVCPEMLGSSNDTRLLIDGTVIKFQTLAGGALASGAGGLDFTGEFHCTGTYKVA